MINESSPNTFKNAHTGSKILVLGCGYSAADFLPLKEKLHNYFDVIIGCNKAFLEFDDVMDYHLVTEKTTKTNGYDLAQRLNSGAYREVMPRLINKKGLDFYSKDKYSIMPITRSHHDGNPDWRSYDTTNNCITTAGFFTGPIGSMKLSLGSVLLQAMHFACILGTNDIYLIGADMCFKGQWDHFYKDRYYRDFNIVKAENRPQIVKVNNFETTNYFAETAIFMDSVIETMLKPLGVNVNDFSDGLISKANKLDIKSFFQGELNEVCV
jgi:hypothetical protein